MRTILSVVSFAFFVFTVFVNSALSQGGGTRFPLIVQDSLGIDTLYWGFDPTATRCIDTALGEFELPVIDPGGFDVRFVDPSGSDGCLGNGLKINLLPKFAVVTDTFRIKLQPFPGTSQYHLSWPSDLRDHLANALLVDTFGGTFVNVNMGTDSTKAVPTSINVLLILTNNIIDLAVREGKLMPGAFELSQNYPNPFNPNTIVRYAVKQTSMIEIVVYDLLGRKVATVVREELMPGNYHSSWNGRDANGIPLSSGVYLLRMSAQVRSNAGTIRTGLFSTVRKMVLVR